MSTELEYLQDRNTLLTTRLEAYMVERRELRALIRELEIEVSKMKHPTYKRDA